jgi:hypothetical protein
METGGANWRAASIIAYAEKKAAGFPSDQLFENRLPMMNAFRTFFLGTNA